MRPSNHPNGAPKAHPTSTEDSRHPPAERPSQHGSEEASLGQRLASSASSLGRAAVSARPTDANEALAAQLQAGEKIQSSNGTNASSSTSAGAASGILDSGNESGARQSSRVGGSFRSLNEHEAMSDHELFDENAKPATIPALMTAATSQHSLLSEQSQSPVDLDAFWQSTTREGNRNGENTDIVAAMSSPASRTKRAIVNCIREHDGLQPLLSFETSQTASLEERDREATWQRMPPFAREEVDTEKQKAREWLTGELKGNPDVLEPEPEWLKLAFSTDENWLLRLLDLNISAETNQMLREVEQAYREQSNIEFARYWQTKFTPLLRGTKTQLTAVENKELKQARYADTLIGRRIAWKMAVSRLLNDQPQAKSAAQKDDSHLSAQDGAEVVELLNKPGSLSMDDDLLTQTWDAPDPTADDLFGAASKPQDPSSADLESAIRASLPPPPAHDAFNAHHPLNLKPEGFDADDEGFLASWRDVLERYTDDVWDPASQPWIREARQEMKQLAETPQQSQMHAEDEQRSTSVRRLRQILGHVKVPRGEF